LTREEKPLAENQISMRANFRRPLLRLEAVALILLGFVLYPALMHFSRSFFRGGKVAFYDSGQQQGQVCEDAWLFLRRSEISRELVQALKVQSLGRCGEVRQPARKREGYANYISRDPGFVLPDQSPAFRGNADQTRHQLFVTTPQARRRMAETNTGQELKVVRSE
jgi:hypothetical protein